MGLSAGGATRRELLTGTPGGGGIGDRPGQGVGSVVCGQHGVLAQGHLEAEVQPALSSPCQLGRPEEGHLRKSVLPEGSFLFPVLRGALCASWAQDVAWP